jgi:hypothetical protein
MVGRTKKKISFRYIQLPIYEKHIPVHHDNEYEDPHPFTKTWNSQYRGQGQTAQWYYDTPKHKWVFQQFNNCPGSALSAPPNKPALPTWGANDLAQLVGKLGAKMRGSDFNVGSFLGAEGLDTLKFLGDTAETLAKSLFYAKKGRIDLAIKTVLRSEKQLLPRKHIPSKRYAVWKNDQLEVYRTLVKKARTDPALVKREGWRRVSAQKWLEFHLAAEPLLGDAKAAAEMLGYRLNHPPTVNYRVGKKKITPGPSMGSNWPLVLGEYLFAENFVGLKVSLMAYLREDPTTYQLSGLMDPEVVIWNALPLTFVADYWLPISDYLEARAIAQKLTGKFVTSVKIWRRFSHPGMGLPFEKVMSDDANTGLTRRVGGGTGSPFYSEQGSFTRSVSTSLVDQLDLPTVKPLGALSSWQRTATVAALVTSYATGGTPAHLTR